MSSRQTATATSILRVLLAAAGKEIRLKSDGVSMVYISGLDVYSFIYFKSLTINLVIFGHRWRCSHLREKETVLFQCNGNGGSAEINRKA